MIDPSDPKVIFAKRWYDRRECPGCGASLQLVAGQGIHHIIPGQMIKPRGGNKHIPAEPGHITTLRPDKDGRVCQWTSDDLTSLVYLATGDTMI